MPEEAQTNNVPQKLYQLRLPPSKDSPVQPTQEQMIADIERKFRTQQGAQTIEQQVRQQAQEQKAKDSQVGSVNAEEDFDPQQQVVDGTNTADSSTEPQAIEPDELVDAKSDVIVEPEIFSAEWLAAELVKTQQQKLDTDLEIVRATARKQLVEDQLSSTTEVNESRESSEDRKVGAHIPETLLAGAIEARKSEARSLLGKLKDFAKEKWGNMDLKQKTALIVGISALIAAGAIAAPFAVAALGGTTGGVAQFGIASKVLFGAVNFNAVGATGSAAFGATLGGKLVAGAAALGYGTLGIAGIKSAFSSKKELPSDTPDQPLEVTEPEVKADSIERVKNETNDWVKPISIDYQNPETVYKIVEADAKETFAQLTRQEINALREKGITILVLKKLEVVTAANSDSGEQEPQINSAPALMESTEAKLEARASKLFDETRPLADLKITYKNSTSEIWKLRESAGRRTLSQNRGIDSLTKEHFLAQIRAGEITDVEPSA